MSPVWGRPACLVGSEHQQWHSHSQKLAHWISPLAQGWLLPLSSKSTSLYLLLCPVGCHHFYLHYLIWFSNHILVRTRIIRPILSGKELSTSVLDFRRIVQGSSHHPIIPGCFSPLPVIVLSSDWEVKRISICKISRCLSEIHFLHSGICGTLRHFRKCLDHFLGVKTHCSSHFLNSICKQIISMSYFKMKFRPSSSHCLHSYTCSPTPPVLA